MNVAYQASNLFSGPLLVSLYSLLKNNPDEKYFNVYILSPDFNEENKGKVENLLKVNNREFKVEIIYIPDFKEKFGFKIDSFNGKWGQNSYIRLCLGYYLPEDIKRVLYFDSDTLVVGSLADLWNLDLEGYAAAAVSDSLSIEYYDYFGLDPKKDCYCNSGVILFNLEEVRRMDAIAKIKEYLDSKNGYVFFVEQTAFNVVFKGKIKFLSLKYNVTSNVIQIKKKQLISLRHPVENYALAEFDEAKSNPVILHMTSSFFLVNRPWYEKCSYKNKYIFDEYAKDVKDFVYFKDSRSFKKKLIDFVVCLIPKGILFYFVGKYYRKNRIKKYISYSMKG